MQPIRAWAAANGIAVSEREGWRVCSRGVYEGLTIPLVPTSTGWAGRNSHEVEHRQKLAGRRDGTQSVASPWKPGSCARDKPMHCRGSRSPSPAAGSDDPRGRARDARLKSPLHQTRHLKSSRESCADSLPTNRFRESHRAKEAGNPGRSPHAHADLPLIEGFLFPHRYPL